MIYNDFVPSFTCEYCGESIEAYMHESGGMFVPCDCKKSREKREFDHRVEMERRKRARRRF